MTALSIWYYLTYLPGILVVGVGGGGYVSSHLKKAMSSQSDFFAYSLNNYLAFMSLNNNKYDANS